MVKTSDVERYEIFTDGMFGRPLGLGNTPGVDFDAPHISFKSDTLGEQWWSITVPIDYDDKRVRWFIDQCVSSQEEYAIELGVLEHRASDGVFNYYHIKVLSRVRK